MRDGYPRALVCRAGRGRVRGRGQPRAPGRALHRRARGGARIRARSDSHRDVVIQTPVVVLALAARGEQDRRIPPAGAALRPCPDRRYHGSHHAFRERERSPRTRAPPPLCGTPHGLADALSGSRRRWSSSRSGQVRRPSRCTCQSVRRRPAGNMFRTHPPIGKRVERLRDLDSDWRERLRADAA